jgi:glycerophosphoryl diester phosphodiesterase
VRPAPAPVLISAHRCGAGGDVDLENSREALDRAPGMGVDFVELDVQRCRDGALVVFHDEWVVVDGEQVPIEDLTHAEVAAHTGRPLLEYADVLDALAAGETRAHLDLKFTSPRELYDHPHRPGSRGRTWSWSTTSWPASASPASRGATGRPCWCGRSTPRSPCATGRAPAGRGS